MGFLWARNSCETHCLIVLNPSLSLLSRIAVEPSWLDPSYFCRLMLTSSGYHQSCAGLQQDQYIWDRKQSRRYESAHTYTLKWNPNESCRSCIKPIVSSDQSSFAVRECGGRYGCRQQLPWKFLGRCSLEQQIRDSLTSQASRATAQFQSWNHFRYRGQRLGL